MGRVMFPGVPEGVNEGELRVLDLAIKTFLQKHIGTENSAIKHLGQWRHDENIELYLTDMQLPKAETKGLGRYEIVAVRRGEKRGLVIECDEGLQVIGVKTLPMDKLSQNSRDSCTLIEQEKDHKVGPSK